VKRTVLAALDATVSLHPASIAPRYDVTALIPLDTPHAVNDLWIEVSACTSWQTHWFFMESHSPPEASDLLPTPGSPPRLTGVDSNRSACSTLRDRVVVWRMADA
jgi:hypothetical protein